MSSSAKARKSVRHLTFFVVQTYQDAPRGGLSLDPPIEARDQAHAMRLFERYKPIRAGVVAFSRTGDPHAGDWGDALILARHGRVSAEVDGLADESEPAIDSWEICEGDLKVA